MEAPPRPPSLVKPPSTCMEIGTGQHIEQGDSPSIAMNNAAVPIIPARVSKKQTVEFAEDTRRDSSLVGGRMLARTESVDAYTTMKNLSRSLTVTTESTVLRRAKTISSLGETEVTFADSRCVDLDIFFMKTDNKQVQGVFELSTLHNDVIKRVKLRVVVLLDVSGSMFLKCGRSRRHSKITIMKKMAVDLVDVLEEGEDLVAVVTFGETVDVVCPLTVVDTQSRVKLKTGIASAGKFGSDQTDLVQGIYKAIDLLRKEKRCYDPTYRNAILLFSDGEINAGLTDPDEIVHAVRQNIRDTNPRPDDLDSQLWLSLSCVTTGGNVSEALYLLSKYGGNDSYYYVDSDLEHPEVDMLVPLLLRKAAIAQYVTFNVATHNGAVLVNDKCSTEHSIRRRGKAPDKCSISYFLHDMQAGSKKNFSFSIDLKNFRHNSGLDLMTINLGYVDTYGLVRSVKKTMAIDDIPNPEDLDKYEKGVLVCAIGDMKGVFQNACHVASDRLLKSITDPPPEMELDKGNQQLRELMTYYSKMALREETKIKINDYMLALMENLNRLTLTLERSKRSAGHKWTKLKAVSSSIVRGTPTVSNLVQQSELLCPLPVFKSCETTRMTALALKLYRQQEVASVCFNNQGLFDAAKVVVQSLNDIVNVLKEVDKVEPESQRCRDIINSMVVGHHDLSIND